MRTMNHNIQPLHNKSYVKAVHAKGIYIYDEHGKEYLDASSGAVTSSLGHSHERLLPHIKQQLDKLQFVYRSQFASEEAEQLATRLFDASFSAEAKKSQGTRPARTSTA